MRESWWGGDVEATPAVRAVDLQSSVEEYSAEFAGVSTAAHESPGPDRDAALSSRVGAADDFLEELAGEGEIVVAHVGLTARVLAEVRPRIRAGSPQHASSWALLGRKVWLGPFDCRVLVAVGRFGLADTFELDLAVPGRHVSDQMFHD